MVKRFLVFNIFLTLLCGCENKKHDNFYEALTQINPEPNPPDNAFYFIMPDLGCSGCIYQAMELYKKHALREDVYIIFTSYISKKKLDLEIALFPHLADNIFFDAKNVMVEKEILAYYPVLLAVEDGKIIFMRDMQPTDEVVLEEFKVLLEP